MSAYKKNVEFNTLNITSCQETIPIETLIPAIPIEDPCDPLHCIENIIVNKPFPSDACFQNAIGALNVQGGAVFNKGIKIGPTEKQINGNIRYKNCRFEGFTEGEWVAFHSHTKNKTHKSHQTHKSHKTHKTHQVEEISEINESNEISEINKAKEIGEINEIKKLSIDDSEFIDGIIVSCYIDDTKIKDSTITDSTLSGKILLDTTSIIASGNPLTADSTNFFSGTVKIKDIEIKQNTPLHIKVINDSITESSLIFIQSIVPEIVRDNNIYRINYHVANVTSGSFDIVLFSGVDITSHDYSIAYLIFCKNT